MENGKLLPKRMLFRRRYVPFCSVKGYKLKSKRWLLLAKPAFTFIVFGVMPRLFYNFIVLREHNGGREMFCFLKVHQGISNYYHGVANLAFPCRRPVEADAATAAFAFYDVRLEPLAVVVVDNLHFLAGYHVCRIHQVFVYGDASHIVKVGFRHLDAVQFAFQDFYHHGYVSLYILCGL